MADTDLRSKPAVAEPEPAEEQRWRGEEHGEGSRRQRARSFFREHPHAKWWLLGIIIIVAVIATLVWRYYAVRETTDDAQIDGHIAPVSARVSGTAVNVYVEDNVYVRAGDLLAQLDPKDYQVAVTRAESELADAEANARAAGTGVPVMYTSTSSTLQTAEANLSAAQKEVDAAEARLRDAEARHNLAVQDLQRFKQLVSKQEIPQQRYDNAVTAEQQAAAGVDAAQAEVLSAQSHVRQAEAQVAGAKTVPQQVAITRSRAGAAEAQVQRARAALEQAQLNLQYTTVRAPVSGIVDKRSVEPGQTVQPGQPLFAIVMIDDLWVTANYKETQLRDMRPGQSATISVDATGKKYKGHVESIGGATGARFSLLPPENATGNFVKVVQRIPVRIAIEPDQDPHHALRPGMSVEPTVITK
ncbi:MAG TPA: HlyD family secretion protein [Terriglobales bacterium]|nr:HlyD family secretion protein [Terriglobales bacterium]